MSIERKCKCGKYEDIRVNFGEDREAEAEFHSEEVECCEASTRKATPIYSGVLAYFPDALADVARVSYQGNEQHNPGSKLHWDRSKSGDELDALTRHLVDAGTLDTDGMRHSAKVAWRALANLQKEIEKEKELKLQDWQEEIIAKSMEDDTMYPEYKYDGECSGELGSHPLCCTDYCPCKEEEIEKRMNIIGQNGNDGLHYGDDDEFKMLNAGSLDMAKSYSHDNYFKSTLSDYPESNWTQDATITKASGDIKITIDEIQTPER